MKRRKRGDPIDLITELKQLRLDAHDRLQVAEYLFFKVDRALNAAKRIQREKELHDELAKSGT